MKHRSEVGDGDTGVRNRRLLIVLLLTVIGLVAGTVIAAMVINS